MCLSVISLESLDQMEMQIGNETCGILAPFLLEKTGPQNGEEDLLQLVSLSQRYPGPTLELGNLRGVVLFSRRSGLTNIGAM